MRLREFALERYFAKWEFSVPIILGASDVEAYTMADLLKRADAETRGLWDRLALGYTESSGHPLLRAEIAKLYQSLAPEQVLVLTPVEGIFIFMTAVLQPGDHAVVVWPAYQALDECARAAQAEVTRLPLHPAGGGWALDLDALRRAVRPTTKVIVINFPHNPTGALLSRRDLDTVAGVARDAGAWLFGDEVYRFLERDPGARLPAVADLDGRTVSFGAMSKSFAMPGLRIGWLATRDQALMERLVRVKDYTSICSSAPSEILALIGLRDRTAVLERSHRIVRRNLEELESFFSRHPERFEWVPPAAGSVTFPRLVSDHSVDELAAALAEEEGTLLVPGTLFDYPGNHFRLGLGRLNLPEGLMRFERFLRRRGL